MIAGTLILCRDCGAMPGYLMRRGTIVLVAVYAMHRAAMWPESDDFNPDRHFPDQPGPPGAPGRSSFSDAPSMSVANGCPNQRTRVRSSSLVR